MDDIQRAEITIGGRVDPSFLRYLREARTSGNVWIGRGDEWRDLDDVDD